MQKGLLIIDVQNEYFQGGKMELNTMEQAAAQCRLLLEQFRAARLPIVHVQQVCAYEGAPVFIPNSRGVEIHELVKPEQDEAVVVKNYPNAFRETALNESLRKAGVGELVICGAMSHMCVDATVRAAFDLGYSCKVVSDACATMDLAFGGRVIKASDVHASFMASLHGVFATVVEAREALKSV